MNTGRVLDWQEVASVLFEGGWRSSDGAFLQQEYSMTDDETERLVAELARLEE